MKKKCYILSFLLLCTTLSFAQLKLTATAGKTEVGTGEQFEVDFAVNGNADSFRPPNFDGFQVLSGPNFSQSMTSINGATTYSTVYTYLLVAAKEGTFLIGPAAVIADGHQARSNPIRIKVIKGQPVQQQTQQAQPNVGRAPAVGNAKDISKLLFIRAEVDKAHVYQGEQLMVTYKLYYLVSILGYQPDKVPDLNGFWSQDIDKTNPNAKTGTEVYNGIRYNTAILKQTILFPEHSGNLTIDPLALTMVVRQEERPTSGDIFDQVFGGGFKDSKYKIQSPPVIIHAIPLPVEGKPGNFSGAVGSFSMVSGVDRKELKANESLNFSTRVTGTGNLNLINAPAITPPADFEKYDPKVTDKISVTANGVSGSREFTYLMIPRHQGDYSIDPPGFSYFNPATKRYVNIPAERVNVKVNKGDAQAAVTTFNSTDQQDIKTLGKDIRYIKTSAPDLYKDGEGFYGSFLFYLLLVTGPLLFAAAFIYRKWDEQQNRDPVKLKSRKANKIAAKHLATANKQLLAGNKKEFYEAISKGLYGYLSDKLNIPAADLNRENIIEQLKARSLNDAIISQLVDTMDLCEMARFAPVTGISEQQVYDKAKNSIHEIENNL